MAGTKAGSVREEVPAIQVAISINYCRRRRRQVSESAAVVRVLFTGTGEWFRFHCSRALQPERDPKRATVRQGGRQ